jgi:hypothetical protein
MPAHQRGLEPLRSTSSSTTQRERDARRRTTAKARDCAEATHVRAECALIEHPTLKRWLMTSNNGRMAIDRAKVKAEERLGGKYLLTRSDPHLTAEEIAVGYKAFLEAERGFRDLKSWNYGRSSTASSTASARTCCCAGSLCC